MSVPFVVILLAAGNSTRYNKGNHDNAVGKQFAKICNGGNTSPIECAIKTAKEAGINKVVVVVNSRGMRDLAAILVAFPAELVKGVSVVINDVDSREQSIRTAFMAIDAVVPPRGIIIHDVARPFITPNHIKVFMDLPETIKYAQYYMRIMGGLMCVSSAATGQPPHFVDRNDYIETCTPLYIHYETGKKILDSAAAGSVPEFFTLLGGDVSPQSYIFIEGEPAYLRKITYATDALTPAPAHSLSGLSEIEPTCSISADKSLIDL